jgi:hypothetical protein
MRSSSRVVSSFASDPLAVAGEQAGEGVLIGRAEHGVAEGEERIVRERLDGRLLHSPAEPVHDGVLERAVGRGRQGAGAPGQFIGDLQCDGLAHCRRSLLPMFHASARAVRKERPDLERKGQTKQLKTLARLFLRTKSSVWYCSRGWSIL